MFQFPSFAFYIRRITQLHCAGFPHSDILGSKVICTSPKLLAAYHVLHRLPEPRHPPFALNLLFLFFLIQCMHCIYIRSFNALIEINLLNPQWIHYRIALLLLLYFLFLPICQRSYFSGQLIVVSWQLSSVLSLSHDNKPLKNVDL